MKIFEHLECIYSLLLSFKHLKIITTFWDQVHLDFLNWFFSNKYILFISVLGSRSIARNSRTEDKKNNMQMNIYPTALQFRTVSLNELLNNFSSNITLMSWARLGWINNNNSKNFVEWANNWLLCEIVLPPFGTV